MRRKDFYFGKMRELVNRPKKIRYLPDFIKQEYFLSIGRITRKIDDVGAKFVVETEKDYKKINNLENEEEIIRDLISSLKKEDVFYDIGANIGMYSCFLGNKVDEIILFEPGQKNLERLRKNLKLNKIHPIIVEKALMNENVDMGLQGDKKTVSGGLKLSREGESVETRRQDEIIKENDLPFPTVIKIDVEGAELEVLKGLEKALKNSECRTIYLETHPRNIKDFDGSIEEVKKFIKRKGYQVENIGQRESRLHKSSEKASIGVKN